MAIFSKIKERDENLHGDSSDFHCLLVHKPNEIVIIQKNGHLQNMRNFVTDVWPVNKWYSEYGIIYHSGMDIFMICSWYVLDMSSNMPKILIRTCNVPDIVNDPIPSMYISTMVIYLIKKEKQIRYIMI